MKNKTFLKIALYILTGILVAGIGGLYAGTEVADVFKMETKAYKKHKKGIVEFSHKKHNEEYKAGCGECHHNEKGEPLNDLKMGNNVDKCITCHKNTDEKPKGKKLTKEEKLQYHHEAMHANCRVCHKAHNKKMKTKAAPTACSKCHPKKKM